MLKWEAPDDTTAADTHSSILTCRPKTPCGWLVSVLLYIGEGGGSGLAFYPDPNHQWNGNSI